MVACQIWGSQWQHKRIIFHAIIRQFVRIWQSGLSRSGLLMQLVRQLFLLAASNNFTVIIRHVPGVQNCIADSLSRFQMDRFRFLASDALPLPITTPAIPTLPPSSTEDTSHGRNCTLPVADICSWDSRISKILLHL